MFNNFLTNFNQNPLYNDQYYYLANHLLSNSVLFTVRYQKNNSLGFRLFDNLDITDLTLKNEDRDNKKDKLFDYLKTYRNFGGYAMPLPLEELPKINPKPPKEEIILTSFVSGELFFSNEEFNIIIHLEINFVNYFGDYFTKNFITHMTDINFLQDPIDYIVLILEIIYLINFIVHFSYFFRKIYNDTSIYLKWFGEQKKKYGVSTLNFRQRVKPEFLRYFEFMLDLNRILDFVIMILSFSNIILKCLIYQLTFKLGNSNFYFK